MAKQAKVIGVDEQRIEVSAIHTAEVHFNLLGASPLIMHRYAQKAWQEMLYPSIRENRAGLEQRLKHDPFAEYRAAFYLNREKDRPALFHFPSGGFHKSIAAAALDMPGAAKAQIERLTTIADVQVDLYGVPEIFCAMVRNSDIRRTPDVRTRPIFPRWACRITVRYVRNRLTERTIANLVGAAGVIVGLGDWRPQRGGPFGTSKLVSDKDRAFNNLIKNEARAAQKKAFDRPGFYDADTEELLTWFETEVKRREMHGHLVAAEDDEIDVGLKRALRVHAERGDGHDAQYMGVEQ